MLQDIGVDQPKAARQEDAFSRRQAVVGGRGVVTHDESIDQ
jgi:hypothetical protein